MKNGLILILLLSMLAFAQEENIYDLPLKNVDGKKVELSNYKGKKIMFIVLPVSEQDSIVRLNELEMLQKKLDSSLVVIGVLSEEGGYRKQSDPYLKKLYSAKMPHVIITEGMKVRKSGGENQAPLFKWLTSKDKNKHFDIDVKGPGHKYVVDEQGKLYAVIGPEVNLFHPLMGRILSKQINK